MKFICQLESLVKMLVVIVLCFFQSALLTADPVNHTLELRITDHKDGIADFQELLVSLESISIHKVSAGRSEGWLQVYGKTPLIDIVPLKDGKYVTVDFVDIPAAKYDAVRIRFSQLTSKLLAGGAANLSARNSTVATDINLDQHEKLALVIDLYAEDQTEHENGGYVVKVKDIRIEE